MLDLNSPGSVSRGEDVVLGAGFSSFGGGIGRGKISITPTERIFTPSSPSAVAQKTQSTMLLRDKFQKLVESNAPTEELKAFVKENNEILDGVRFFQTKGRQHYIDLIFSKLE